MPEKGKVKKKKYTKEVKQKKSVKEDPPILIKPKLK